jgi:hypothetical protein
MSNTTLSHIFVTRIPRCSLLSIATLVASLAVLNCSVGSSRADSLAYSFESPTIDGFTANGPGISVSQDTIGATVGTHSLKIAIGAGFGFVGAQTSVLDTTTIGNSAIIGNPPGLDHVTFDLTLPAQFPDGDFALLGMTVFGQTPDGTPIDAQFQSNEVHIDGLAAGTYTNMKMDLTSATLVAQGGQGPGGSFNDLFGTGLRPDGGPKLIPTGLQFYINKKTLPADALTMYLDNIRFGTTPAAIPGDYNSDGVVDAADFVIWRQTLNSTTDLRANGDNTGASANVIDQADYTFWKSRFGATSGSGSGALSSGAVPEPSGAALLLIAGVCCWGAIRGRAAR